MKKLILIIILFFSVNIIAQGEANIWYFGANSGLDFSNCDPVPLTDGMLNNTEGCSSISNAYGELLFYSDGVTVWNKNHEVMTSNLLGHRSSSQSALIIPHPGNYYQYLLFVTSTNGVFPDMSSPDFNYYTIDMTENNGLGGLLGGPTNLAGNRKAAWSEKIAAVKGNFVRTSWVVSYAKDEFYAYRVTESGVSGVPVKSLAGDFTTTEAIGYLKISPNGEKIAIAHYTTLYENGGPVSGEVFLYDFNDVTGRVTNGVSLILSDAGTRPYGVEFSADSRKLYITAHSGNIHPNDINTNDVIAGTLYQLDLTKSSIIPRVIDTRGSNIKGALQLGPDEKIYLAQSRKFSNGSPFLGVINNPEAVGDACDYENSGITLINNSTSGLPPFNASFSSQLQIISVNENNEEDFVYSVLELCEGEKVTLSSYINFDNATYIWYHNRRIISNDSSITINSNPNIDNGEYILEINYLDNCGNQKSSKGEFSIYIHQTPNVVEEVTLNNCDDDGVLDGFTLFNLEHASIYFRNDQPPFGNELKSSYYLTLDDAETATNPINTSIPFNSAIQNPLYVRIEDLNNCGFYDTSILNLEVSSNSMPEGFTVTLETCDDDLENDGLHTFNLFDVRDEIFAEFPDENSLSIRYYTNELDAQLDQNLISFVDSYINQTPFSQMIYVRLNNDTGDCFGIGPLINLVVNLIPEFELDEDDVYVCTNTSQSITLSTYDANGEYTYTWTNEAGTIIGNAQSLTVSEEGNYTVTAKSFEGCSSSPKTVTVLSIPEVQLELSNIRIVEENELNTITINSLNDGLNFEDYEFSIDNATGPFQNEPVFEMVTVGDHYIYIRDKLRCSITSLKISIFGFPKFFTPNNDGKNDYWNIIGYDINRSVISNVYIYDRFGKIIFEIDLSSDGWDGTYNGEDLPESDYWYSGIIINSSGEKQTFNGHFSLIRR
ncbi:MAG: T9SS type B sorting domain-containing protein [Flavobacteriaceae bacterium]